MKRSKAIFAMALCTFLLLIAAVALAADPYLVPASISLRVNEKKSFSLRYAPSDAEVAWSSSDEKIATVEKGYVKGISPGSATITAKIDGYDDFTAEVTVKEISLPDTDISLKIGGFKVISASGIYTETSDTDIQWFSSNPAVATVEQSSNLYSANSATVWAVSPGEAEISIVVNGFYTLKANVTVAAPTLNITSAKIRVGEHVDLSLTGHSISRYDLKWASSDPAVATVGDDNYFDTSRRVTARSPGKATITVSYHDQVIASAKITVPGAKLSPASFTLGVKKTKKMKVTGIGSVAYNELKWTSSDTSVAKVDEYGTVTGVAVGTAKISVRINDGKTYSSTVTVVPAFASDTEYVAVGETLELKLEGLPKGAKVKWKSSKSKIAKVNKKGVVTAGKKTGKTTVSVKYGEETYTVKVVVKPKVEITVRRITDTSIYNEVYLDFHNYSKKKVVYVKFNITQYNNAGTKLKSPYDWYYLNETIKARGTQNNWEYWVNGDTKKVKIKLIEVTFKGGSKWRP